MDGWNPKLKEMIPSFGEKLNSDAGKARQNMAATAKVGQTVSTPNGPRRITKIEYYRQRGAYHIIVPGGMYYVDGTSRPPCPTRHRRKTFV